MDKLLSNLIIEAVDSVTTMYNEAGTASKRINREKWALIIKYEGETTYISGKKSILSNIDHIVILPAGCSYEWKCTSSGSYISAEFQCKTKHDSILSLSISNGEELLAALKKLEYKRLSKRQTEPMESIRDLYTVILKLIEQLRREYVPGEKAKKLLPAVEYILSNYTKSITNDSLAARTGLSTVYFRKLFKEVYGISPIEYIKHLRIKKAKEMLCGDYGSVTDIAISLGYSGIYDFSRDFKKHIGISPSKYAKQQTGRLYAAAAGGLR